MEAEIKRIIKLLNKKNDIELIGISSEFEDHAYVNEKGVLITKKEKIYVAAMKQNSRLLSVDIKEKDTEDDIKNYINEALRKNKKN